MEAWKKVRITLGIFSQTGDEWPLLAVETEANDIQQLDLGTTSQVHVCDIIKSLKSKGSCDVDGISTKLLKTLAIELSWPLAHIFRLSLQNGIFPSKLKKSMVVPIFTVKPEIDILVITTALYLY